MLGWPAACGKVLPPLSKGRTCRAAQAWKRARDIQKYRDTALREMAADHARALFGGVLSQIVPALHVSYSQGGLIPAPDGKMTFFFCCEALSCFWKHWICGEQLVERRWDEAAGKHFFTRQLRAAAMLCTPSRREDIKSGHKTGLNLNSNRTGRINKGVVVTKEIFILFLCKKRVQTW